MSAVMEALATETRPRRTAAGISPTRRIVVIDDDDVIRLSCERVLGRAGYEVESFDRGADGLARIAASPPPLLLVDLKMPEMDGFEVIDQVRRVAPNVVIVVITGYATIATAVDAMKAGAYDFLPKPFTPDELRLIVERGLEKWHLERESEWLRGEKERTERRFVTFVSHQLKSPLVAAKQYLDVLTFSPEGLSPQAREWISRSSERLGGMIQLIHDWLALARVEQGRLGEEASATALPDLVAAVTAECAPLAEPRRVRVLTELAGELPRVLGDELSLRTVLANLLTNAITYNREGGTVTVRAFRSAGGVSIEVADTGIGVPEESLGTIFDEFVRVRSRETEGISGSGLGLTICKAIVTQLGGTISARSREGEGSTFTVWLPAEERP